MKVIKLTLNCLKRISSIDDGTPVFPGKEVSRMCCEPEDAKTSSPTCCCCCETSRPTRRFVSSKEEAERLERYKEELEREIAGVNERIDDLKKK
jgi:hypothetical protein